MSDILRPNQDQASPEIKTVNPTVPHSGNVPPEQGGERPVVEFSKPLAEANEENLLKTPEDVAALTGGADTDTKKPRRFPRKTVAAVTALAVLGGGFLASRSRSEGPESAQPGATQPATGDTPGFVAPDFEVPEDTPSGSVEAGAGRGNIDLTANLGSDYITATRPNGQEIKVARLGGDTPAEIASSALGLVACYLTAAGTGSEKCKVAFSTNTGVQAKLEKLKADAKIDRLLANPNNAAMQVVVFDDLKDPAIFTQRPDQSGRGTIVELTGGTLYFGRYIDPTGTNEWQGPETRATGGLESKVTSMSLNIRKTNSGIPTVDQFEYDIRQVA